MRHEQRNRPVCDGAVPEGGWRADTHHTGDSDTDAGVAAARANTYTPHAQTFLATVAVMSNSRTAFDMDDVLDLMGHPVLGSVGAHGALMREAARAHGLRAVGYVKSKRTGGLITRWSRYGGGDA